MSNQPNYRRTISSVSKYNMKLISWHLFGNTSWIKTHVVNSICVFIKQKKSKRKILKHIHVAI